MLSKFSVLAFLLVSEAVLTYAQQLYVQPVDVSGRRNDCNEIDRPCTLQRAVYIANDGDELILREGNYTAASGRIADINDSITLTGGWNGADRIPLTINPELYPSIIDGNHTTAGLYIAPQKDVTIRGVTFARCYSDENGSALYDFNATALHLVNDTFIDNISSSDSVNPYGGALFLTGGNLDINQSVFENNGAAGFNNAYGGALCVFDANGTVSNSRFVSNTSWNGSAIYWNSKQEKDTSASILNTLFRENGKGFHTPNSYTIGGYGIVSIINTDTIITSSSFKENSVTNQGTAAVLQGSPLTPTNTKIFLEENVFTNNEFRSFTYNSLLEIGFAGQVAVSNNVFADNTRHQDSNATVVNLVKVDANHDGSAVVAYNTFTGNDGNNSVKISNDSYVQMANNIFADTTAAVYIDDAASYVHLYYNNLDWNVTTRFAGDGSANVDDEQNSTTGNPRFQNDGWHLGAGSAAIDKALCIDLTHEDIEGDARPSGNGCDIGADEFTDSGMSPGLLMYLLN